MTTNRILWGRPGAISTGQTCLALDLSLIIYVEEESPSNFSFSRSRKVILHLSEATGGMIAFCTHFYILNCFIVAYSEGPQQTSIYNFVKLSFKEGFQSDFVNLLENCIQKSQQPQEQIKALSKPQLPQIKLRTGIVGIERSLQEKQKAANESIAVAFQDLDKLMTMAKDMVHLSRTISNKIRDKQGDITEDETVRFKSYLLSLGIDDPVTRGSYKSDSQYYRSLAKQISEILQRHIKDMGGMMAMTDVFCRVNRARGLEMLSPEDTLNACQLMEVMALPLKLYQFNSGVMVLQLTAMNDESVAEDTAIMVCTGFIYYVNIFQLD